MRDLEYFARLLDDTIEEKARQAAILRARKFHAGMHHVELSAALRRALADCPKLGDYAAASMNMIRIVVTAINERLKIREFTTPSGSISDLLWQWYTKTQGQIVASRAHEQAIRDGESFIMVLWDSANNRPRFMAEPRYVGPEVAKDYALADELELYGHGCIAVYQNNDTEGILECVHRRWIEIRRDGKEEKRIQRLTSYYPDRIEKYTFNGMTWEEHSDEGDESWPIPWVDRSGQPLGIPIVHVQNQDMQCEAWPAMPLQNSVNKLLADFLHIEHYEAHSIYVASGFVATTDGKPVKPDGSNQLKLTPGSIVSAVSSNPAIQPKLERLDGQDFERMLSSIDRLIVWLATVSDTPISRFYTNRQVMSAESQQEQERPFLAKVEKRQILFGTAWEQAMFTALRLGQVFGMNVPITDQITVEWESLKEESKDSLLSQAEQLKTLGFPFAEILRHLGYTEVEIKRIQSEVDNERSSANQYTEPTNQPTRAASTDQPAEPDPTRTA